MNKKLITFNWKRFLFLPKDDPKKVPIVWDTIKEIEVKQEIVEELFENKRKEIKVGGGAENKTIAVAKKRTFFDADK